MWLEDSTSARPRRWNAYLSCAACVCVCFPTLWSGYRTLTVCCVDIITITGTSFCITFLRILQVKHYGVMYNNVNALHAAHGFPCLLCRSFGVLLWEMVTYCDQPYGEQNADEIIAKIEKKSLFLPRCVLRYSEIIIWSFLWCIISADLSEKPADWCMWEWFLQTVCVKLYLLQYMYMHYEIETPSSNSSYPLSPSLPTCTLINCNPNANA